MAPFKADNWVVGSDNAFCCDEFRFGQSRFSFECQSRRCGSGHEACLCSYRVDQVKLASKMHIIRGISISPCARYLGQVVWYWGMYPFRGPAAFHGSLGDEYQAANPSLAVSGIGSGEVLDMSELSSVQQSIGALGEVRALQQSLLWGKFCLDVLTALMVGIGLFRRMLDQVWQCRHSRRAKKLVRVGNARRQARLPIQVKNAVWRVIFFTYLLTVDASSLNNIGNRQLDEVPVRRASNETLACSHQAGQLEQSQPAFVDVAFFDDAAFCIVAKDCQQVLTLAAQALAILSDAARKRGMNINFKPDKTEILFACSGPGSRALKKRIHIEQSGCIPVVLEHSVEQVRCVHSYKHLGSYVQSDATPAREVQHRIAEAKKAWGPLVRNLWCNPSVSQSNKQKLFRSLIGSRFFYHCHVWSWLRDEDLRKLQYAFRDLIKPLVKPMLAGHEAHAFKTAELAAFCNMLEPAQQITVNRLRYLARAAKYQPEALWRILQASEHEASWKHTLAQDLQWLKSHYPSGDWPAPEADLIEVCAFAARDHQWKAKVKKAEHAAIRYALRVAKHKLWTLKMHDAFQSYGLSFSHQGEKMQAAVFECQLCMKTFPTKRGLYMHSAHMHGYRPKVRYLAGGSCCLVCRKEYHVRPRLMQHLRYSHECARILFEIFPPLSSDVVEELDETDRQLSAQQKALGWQVKKAHLPAMKVPSAELPPVGSPEAQAIFRKCQVEADSSPPWYNVDGLRTASQCAPEPVIVPETAHLFQQGRGSNSGPAGVLRRESVSVWDARVHLRTVVFVHLFSGFRRQNDLQSCIEAHTWVHSTETFCLSVDLCLQGAEGDLLDPVRVRWWRERILSRQVIGVGGGPPCETWSVARWLGSGPPPLRDRQSPWGLKHLTRKQHLQVSVGSGLLEVAMELLSLVMVHGGCGFIEHPQTATWMYGTPCPSIWRLKEIREMAAADAVSVVSFDQCVFGAAGVKPTTLMLVRMEAFREIVMQLGLSGRCPHGPGAHVGLAGKCQGAFRTARAKIYPEALNAALAHAFHCFVFRLSPESSQEGLPHEFQQLHAACTVEDAAHVQPDYHG